MTHFPTYTTNTALAPGPHTTEPGYDTTHTPSPRSFPIDTKTTHPPTHPPTHPHTHTFDAWESLHAAVVAPAPSPNAFAVEKHARAAAATQTRRYIPTTVG